MMMLEQRRVRLTFLTLLLAVFWAGHGQAQTKNVELTGRVVDEKTGDPLVTIRFM